MIDFFNSLYVVESGALPITMPEYSIEIGLPIENISGGNIPNPPKSK